MGDYYGHGAGGAGGAGSSSNNRPTPRTTTAASTIIPKNLLPPGASVPGSSLQHSDHVKIFVGGLSWQTTEESLRWHFETYGEVVSVEVMRDRHTGDPRGFAFVVFADPSTVDLVMADKDKHEINHKFVDVKRAQARGVAPPSIHERQAQQAAAAASAAAAGRAPAESPSTASSAKAAAAGGGGAPGPDQHGPASSSGGGGGGGPTPEQMQTKVFVGGIPPHVGRDELKQVFEQFGQVVDAIVMMDQHTQRSRGFGFVTFHNQQPDGSSGAAAAERSIRAQPVDVYGRQAEVKLATPRAEPPPGAGGSGMGGTSGGHHHSATTKQRGSTLPPGPKHVGLRAGQQAANASSGEFAGLAVAYGRNGWKAGYGTKAFGKAGWDVWEDTLGAPPEQAGFSFSMLQDADYLQPAPEAGPPVKRPRH